MSETVQRLISELQPHPRNYNKHSDKQVDDLSLSLKKFGQRKPIVTWRNMIVAGHGLTMAAQMAGWSTILTMPIPDEWDEATVLAYLAADNELARQANPDIAQLAAIAKELEGIDGELALLAAGGDDALKALMATLEEEQPCGDTEPQIDKAEELRQKWNVETGQMWQLGEHRIICGDCTDRAVVERVMGGEKADCVITDPEYNMDMDWLEINIDVCLKHWLISCGDKQAAQICNKYIGNFNQFFILHFRKFSWNLNKYIPLLTHLVTVHLKMKDAKNYDLHGMHSLVESASKFDPEQPHNHAKHIDRTIEFIKGFSAVNELVVDFFSGSGTTIVACENTGRRCRAVEISPAYVAVAIQRWVDVTGKEPVLL